MDSRKDCKHPKKFRMRRDIPELSKRRYYICWKCRTYLRHENKRLVNKSAFGVFPFSTLDEVQDVGYKKF